MFDRNIPKHFWGDAVLNLLIAAYLINRMPSKVLNFQTLIGTLKECYPFFFDWKRHKDLLIDKKYKRRMRNPPAKDS